MKIRKYRKSDRKDFLALVRALAKYEKLRGPGPAEARRLISEIGRRIEVLIAACRGRAAGYAIYFFTYSSFLARPTLYLEDIFVLPEYRRCGAGKAIWRHLKREARRKRCGRMEWMVLDWNKPAHDFYQKMGAKRLREWVPYRVGIV